MLPVSDTLCDSPTALPRRLRCCGRGGPWREQGRACLISMNSAPLASASVGALALCVLVGCTTALPRAAAEEHEVTPSDQTGQQATGVSQQDVITTIKGLQAVSLPLLIQDHGIDRGLAEFKKRIEVVLRAIIIVCRSPL